MKSQVKEYIELKKYCDLARAIPPKCWTTNPPISQVPLIKEYPGLREDLPFLSFCGNIIRLKARYNTQTFTFGRRIIDEWHMYLYPGEEVGITVTGKSNYDCSAIHRGNSFADRFYTKLSGAFNDILGTLSDPLYHSGFRNYIDGLISKLQEE